MSYIYIIYKLYIRYIIYMSYVWPIHTHTHTHTQVPPLKPDLTFLNGYYMKAERAVAMGGVALET